MIKLAITFLIVALIAGALGYSGIIGTAAVIAKFLFYLFVAIFILLLMFGIFLDSRSAESAGS